MHTDEYIYAGTKDKKMFTQNKEIFALQMFLPLLAQQIQFNFFTIKMLNLKQ